MRFKRFVTALYAALILCGLVAACGVQTSNPSASVVQTTGDYSNVTPTALFHNGTYYCVWTESRDACQGSTDPNGSLIPESNWVEATDPGISYSPDSTLLAMVIWSYFLGHQVYYTSNTYVHAYVPADRRSAYYSTWKTYDTRYARHLPRLRKQSQWTSNSGQVFTGDSKVKPVAVQPPLVYNQRSNTCASGRPRSMSKAGNQAVIQAVAFATRRPPVIRNNPPVVKSTPKAPAATTTAKPSYAPPAQESAQPTYVPQPNPVNTGGGRRRNGC